MTERSTRIVLIGPTTFIGFYIVLPLITLEVQATVVHLFVSRNSKTKIILIHVLLHSVKRSEANDSSKHKLDTSSS